MSERTSFGAYLDTLKSQAVTAQKECDACRSSNYMGYLVGQCKPCYEFTMLKARIVNAYNYCLRKQTNYLKFGAENFGPKASTIQGWLQVNDQALKELKREHDLYTDQSRSNHWACSPETMDFINLVIARISRDITIEFFNCSEEFKEIQKVLDV